MKRFLIILLIVLAMVISPLTCLSAGETATPDTMEWIVYEQGEGLPTVHMYTFYHERTKTDHPFAAIILCPKHNLYEVTFVFGGEMQPIPLHWKTLDEAKAYVEDIAQKIYQKYLDQTGA